MIFHLVLLVASAILLFRSANWLVQGITSIANYLHWREFVIAFFVMAIGSSFPNLFVGISSVMHNIPELSFGDVVGNSVVDLTLLVALAVFLGGTLTAESGLVQKSVKFTILIAILPLLLIMDGVLGRGDSFVLFAAFAVYSWWLFTHRKLYNEVFANNQNHSTPLQKFHMFWKGFAKALLSVALLILAAEGVVRSMSFYAAEFNLPLPLVGMLGIGLGSALPEMYFAIVAARKGKNWIILGELMGSVVILATLVLGVVAFLKPIVIPDFSSFAIARVFLVIAALIFFVAVKTGKKITKREAFILLFIYIAFVAAEIVKNGLAR